MFLLHQINLWYCKGTHVCQSVNCQSLMSYWLYRVGFEIGSCFSCKRANDSHCIVFLKLYLNIRFFVLHPSFGIYLFIVLFLGLYFYSFPGLSPTLHILHQQLHRLHVLLTLLQHNVFPLFDICLQAVTLVFYSKLKNY